MGRDFYAELGVSKTCTDDELKKAYKKCAMRWHPDRHSSKSDKERDAASEKFKNVAEAYEVLSDKSKREVYDRYGEEGLKAGGAAPSGGGMGGMPGGFGGMPAGFSSFGNGATTFSFSTGGGGGGAMDSARAQELFASLFGAGGLGGGLSGAHFGGSSENDDPFANLMMGGGMMGGGMGGGMGSGVMGGRRRRGGARSARVDVLAQGATVRLTGLNNSSHNNAVGYVESFDEAKQRYVVSLSSGASIAVRPHNVRQVITTATVVGTSQDEINGATPAATTYDASSKRYRCEGLRPDGTVVSLRPENVMLPQECRVTIDGVSSRKELNGKVGRVRGVENDRYVVDLPNNEAVRLRFGAVAAC